MGKPKKADPDVIDGEIVTESESKALTKPNGKKQPISRRFRLAVDNMDARREDGTYVYDSIAAAWRAAGYSAKSCRGTIYRALASESAQRAIDKIRSDRRDKARDVFAIGEDMTRESVNAIEGPEMRLRAGVELMKVGHQIRRDLGETDQLRTADDTYREARQVRRRMLALGVAATLRRGRAWAESFLARVADPQDVVVCRGHNMADAAETPETPNR